MKIRLWKGFHSDSLRRLLEQTWAAPGDDELLVLCPPFLKDLGFLGYLPAGTAELCGEWGGAEGTELEAETTRGVPEYPARPVLGVFTTGTVSGIPRLVLYSKENIEASLDAILGVFEASKISKIFCYPQPFHTFGLTLGYLLSQLRGYELVTGPGRYSSAAHEVRVALKDEGLLTLGTPTHFHDLIGYVRARQLDLAPSYSAIIGGAKVTSALWREVRDTLKIGQPSIGYGATEASPGIAHHPPGLEPRQDGEIGFAFPQLEVNLHAGRGLEFSGRSLCLATVQGGVLEFPRSMLITDDVRRRDDGMLVYHGRTELILNRGGQKYSLEHMEEVVRQQLDVEIVCVSLPDQRLGEELGVLHLYKDAAEAPRGDRERIHQALCRAFDSKFDLAKIVGVPEFPMNENSKIDRKSGAAMIMRQAGA